MEQNPFQPTVIVENAESGTFGDHATCLRQTFLYRKLQFELPLDVLLIYDGWWFRQKITVNDETVWFRVSWLTIHREAEFNLPKRIDPEQRRCRIEITFSRTLFIQRFQIWLAGEVIYDEIA